MKYFINQAGDLIVGVEGSTFTEFKLMAGAKEGDEITPPQKGSETGQKD